MLAEGPGGRYLIQHSAGSGKTASIGWSSHLLADLHDANDRAEEVMDHPVLHAITPGRQVVTAPDRDWACGTPHVLRAVAQLLGASPAPLPLPAIEASFKGKGPWKKGLPRILDTLEALGRARQEGGGWRG